MTYGKPQVPDLPYDELAPVLAALGHPVRLQIVAGLLAGSCCVGPMVDCLGLPQPLVSRHLGVLREAGVVEATAVGRERRYAVVHPLAAAVVAAMTGGRPLDLPPVGVVRATPVG